MVFDPKWNSIIPAIQFPVCLAPGTVTAHVMVDCQLPGDGSGIQIGGQFDQATAVFVNIYLDVTKLYYLLFGPTYTNIYGSGSSTNLAGGTSLTAVIVTSNPVLPPVGITLIPQRITA